MFLKQKRVMNVNFAKRFVKNGKLHIGVPADEGNLTKLNMDVSKGETSVLPPAYIGINCQRNADGEWIVDKNAEKESRLVNTIYLTWQDWHGNEHGKWCDVIKECYPKHFVEPVLVEIQLTKSSSREYLASVLDINNFVQQKDVIKLTINMFLEIFGCCFLYNEDFSFDISNIKRCQWEFLPQGERIWATAQWEQKMRDKNEKCDDFFQYRLDTINNFAPKEIFEGSKGMTGYFAFVFDDFCVFENGKYGNATYITDANDWQQLSQMSKSELFATNNVSTRLVHNENWQNCIKQFMHEASKK